MTTQIDPEVIRQEMAKVLYSTGVLKDRNAFGNFKIGTEQQISAALAEIQKHPDLKDPHTAKAALSKAAGGEKTPPLGESASIFTWTENDIKAIAQSPDIRERVGKLAPTRIQTLLDNARGAVGAAVAEVKSQADVAAAALKGYRNDSDFGKGTEAAMNRDAKGGPNIRAQQIARGEDGHSNACLGTLTSPSFPKERGGVKSQAPSCAR